MLIWIMVAFPVQKLYAVQSRIKSRRIKYIYIEIYNYKHHGIFMFVSFFFVCL